MEMVAWLSGQATDPGSIVGAGGWAGAGLLGGVLAWLCFFHLPQKDRLIKELITGFQEQVNTLAASFQKQIDTLAAQSLASRTADRAEIVSAVKEHTATILDAYDRALRDREQAAEFSDKRRQQEGRSGS